MHVAIRKGHTQVVDVLRTVEGWTAAHVAADRGDANAFLALVQAGGDLTTKDKRGCTPVDLAVLKGVLHRAASNGHMEMVQVLVAHGANVGAHDEVGALANSNSCPLPEENDVHVGAGGADVDATATCLPAPRHERCDWVHATD